MRADSTGGRIQHVKAPPVTQSWLINVCTWGTKRVTCLVTGLPLPTSPRAGSSKGTSFLSETGCPHCNLSCTCLGDSQSIISTFGVLSIIITSGRKKPNTIMDMTRFDWLLTGENHAKTMRNNTKSPGQGNYNFGPRVLLPPLGDGFAQ